MIRIYCPGSLAGFTQFLPEPQCKAVYFVDGGCKHWRNLGPLNTYVGDQDSCNGTDFEFLENACLKQKSLLKKVILSPDKSVSDFGATLDLLTGDLKFVHVDGALGGRRDHEWINLFEAVNFVGKSENRLCAFGKSVFVSSQRKLELSPNLGSLFSIWPSQSEQKFEIQGARYSGELNLLRPSHGLSNVTTSANLTIKSLFPYILFFEDDHASQYQGF